MFVSDKRVDVLVRVQRPEDWSLVRDEGQDRQQGPTQVRACDRIRLRVNFQLLSSSLFCFVDTCHGGAQSATKV